MTEQFKANQAVVIGVVALSAMPLYFGGNGIGNVLLDAQLNHFNYIRYAIFFGLFAVVTALEVWALLPHWRTVRGEFGDSEDGLSMMVARRKARIFLAFFVQLVLLFVGLGLLLAEERLING